MPEENFEQQARKLTEAFSMEPQPAVWQRVKAAIAPPERKRRALLWWWLLPLCMAGGLSVWLLKNTTSLSADKVALTHEKNDSASFKNGMNGKENKTALQKVPNGNDVNLASSLDLQKKEINVERKKEAITKQKKYNHQPLLAAKESTTKRNTTKINNDLTISRKEESNDVVNSSSSSTNTLRKDKNSGLDSLWIHSQKADEKETDTDTAKAMTANVSADSALGGKDTATAVKNKKKSVKKSYSIGVLAEVGATSLGSPLSASKEQLSPAFLSATPGSLFNLTSGTVTQSKITNGVHLSLGLSVQKKLSKRIYFSGQATYRYQQFGISQTVYTDTTTGGLNGGSGGSSNPGQGRGIYRDVNAVQRLHLMNAYAGIGWQFFTRKHFALSLQAGIDNAFLLSVTQKQNGSADSVKSLPARNFYRWQPSVQFALPFNGYLGKNIHFELSPFVRFGLRTFQKNSASYQDNHLSSAGIQAIYFFK